MSEHVSSTEGKKLLIDNLLDGQGFVKVVNVSPDLHPVNRYPEYLVAKTARASYGSDNRSPEADKRLIEFLVRHKHTSPLEMCSITYCLKLPIAICRQLLRHRTGKFNEFSQRYSEVSEEINRFRLDRYEGTMRGPDKLNKQASGFNLEEDQVSEINDLLYKMEGLQDQVFETYQALLKTGHARELSRFYLPLSTYTVIFVQFDLNNLLKFFNLRCAPDAQLEINVYAKAMRELAQQFFPISIGMHLEYEGALMLGAYEKEMIKTGKIPEEVKSKTHQAYLKEVAEELEIKLS